MLKDVFVTGMGIITAIGETADETLQALKSGYSPKAPARRFETALKDFPVCEVLAGNEALMSGLPLLPQDKPYSRTSLLALNAAGQALQSSPSKVPVKRMGLVSATTVGGMDYNEEHYGDLSSGKVNADSFEILDCADSTQKIAEYFNICYNVTTVSTACSSSANAIIVGARMLQNGLADKVLVGGADALSRFTINGFNSLDIVSPTGCTPFDANRNGITLGEGAAYLVLETRETAAGDSILCRLSGFANTNEAYHQTALSPDGEGAALTVREALKRACLDAGDIDYINAHGTGTVINDLSEGRAVESVFGACGAFGKIPPLSSTKAFTGHTLAAAGAVEAVISILAIGNGLLFANCGFSQQMPELSFTPNIALAEADVRHVLSNSFGFGGSNASLIFSKVS
ncbi:MAG: beta-ketoacyl-[acyl-carrier-protein] synthase family protein [Tannerella sp.]|jgi:3-oxoacyl-[acyl-carrier-protein] synthase-1|nr:beta-ketoacyl-[acyl-carrier-protein] synthase family protein [Tannerella sp.]